MAWRVARSLQVLGDEIEVVAPGTTVWTIGDEDHQDDWSDHNPNECCDVVCAGDILDNAGLDLAQFVEVIIRTDPPALKYLIYQDRIWFPQTGWQPYSGQFHTHAHVSVGWGPDGRSIGNYDDTSPWGLIAIEEDDGMAEISRHRFLELLQWALPRVRYSLVDRGGRRRWAGRLMGRDEMTGNETAMWSIGVADELLVMPQLAALRKLTQALVARQSGLTETQVAAAVAAGVREGFDPEALADLIADRVDGTLDRAAVAAALRDVLGGLDEPDS